MQTLKSLTFVDVSKKQLNNPVLTRRAKLITRLEEQKSLLKDPLFVAVEQRWDRTPDGRKELVEHKRKVRRWWREDATGKIYLSIRYGQKTIEFEKGKAAIAIPSKDAIDGVLDVLIAAVRSGEFDEALSAMSKARKVRKRAAQ
jgi:hypothetical protein